MKERTEAQKWYVENCHVCRTLKATVEDYTVPKNKPRTKKVAQ